MLIAFFVACVLEPAPTLTARFVPITEDVAVAANTANLTVLADGTVVWVEGSALVAWRDGLEVGRSEAVVNFPESLRATGPSAVAALTSSGVLRSTDGGQTFEVVDLPPLSAGIPRGLLVLANDVVIVGPENPSFGELWMSRDAGATFEVTPFPVGAATVFEVRAAGRVLLVHLFTDVHELHTWSPGARSTERIHRGDAATAYPMPQWSTPRGTLLRADAHPWDVGGLAPFVWSREPVTTTNPWDWGAVHSGGVANGNQLAGLSWDGRPILSGSPPRIAAFPLDDPAARPDLYAGPRCEERTWVAPTDIEANAVSSVTVTNDTDQALIPSQIQRTGVFGFDYAQTIPAGATQVFTRATLSSTSWYLLLEGETDGRCYGMWEIDDSPDPTITVLPAR